MIWKFFLEWGRVGLGIYLCPRLKELRSMAAIMIRGCWGRWS